MAILQAKKGHVKYHYTMDDPQTPEGFQDLPSWASSEYDGIVRIKGLKAGRHQVKLNATQWHNGKEVTTEGSFEIEVVE